VSSRGRPVGSLSAPDRQRSARRATALKRLSFPAWCKRYLIQSVDRWAGLPLELEGFQREVVKEALARDGDAFRWKTVVLALPRKNGKTNLLAAYALFRLLSDSGQPEILLAAASDKQAGRLFDAVCSFVYQSPELQEHVHMRAYVGEIARRDGGGKILRMASDPATLHGYNPSLVVADELHAWTKPSQRKGWAALTTGGGGRRLTQVVVISTAGSAEERREGILGQLIDGNEEAGELEQRPGLTISRNHDAGVLVFNYSAPTNDPLDIDSLLLANPASWIDADYLRRQAESPELTPAETLQYHGNVWAAGTKAWLPPGAWDELANPWHGVPDGVDIVLGFDGSYNQDATALVGCTCEETPHVFVVSLWERPTGAKGWVVPRAEVDEAVRRALERWNVLELACDPPGWYEQIDQWASDYGSPPVIQVRTQETRVMSELCSRFYSAVVTHALTHDGHPRLAAHLANAIVRERPEGAVIAKQDRHSLKKIDLAIAAVLAFGRASVAESVAGGIVY
jgi:phage terminase large subunit-like protein